MKNVDEFYKKYYKSYKSDYDANNELSEAKKKKLELKDLKLDGETKKKLSRLKNKIKVLIKRSF